jgi:hypothetical protein
MQGKLQGKKQGKLQGKFGGNTRAHTRKGGKEMERLLELRAFFVRASKIGAAFLDAAAKRKIENTIRTIDLAIAFNPAN